MHTFYKAALAAFFFILCNFSFAQTVRFSSKVVDFGSHSLWNNPYQAIELTNIHSKPIAILRVSGPRGVWYDYTRQYIKPGETVEISLAYYTEEKGAFSTHIDIYISSEMEPSKITLKGNIKGFAFDALTACPTWNKPESKPMEYDHSILVLDSITNEPIKGANITLSFRNEAIGYWKTPSAGKVVASVPAGLYAVNIQAIGYLPIQEGVSLELGGSNLVYKLRRENRVLTQVSTQIQNQTPLPVTEPKPNFRPHKEIITPSEEKDSTETVAISQENKPVDPFASNATLPLEEFKPNNIIFLLDVSSSMNSPARFPLLKQSLLELSGVMRSSDRISVITFTSNSKILLTNIPGYQQDTLFQTFNKLRASGSTNGIKGLETAYSLAQSSFIPDGNNVVILATDGGFRVVEKEINAEEMVKTNAQKGIKLSIVGLGSDVASLENLQTIAAKGNGEYYRMSPSEASNNALIDIIKKLSRRSN